MLDASRWIHHEGGMEGGHSNLPVLLPTLAGLEGGHSNLPVLLPTLAGSEWYV